MKDTQLCVSTSVRAHPCPHPVSVAMASCQRLVPRCLDASPTHPAPTPHPTKTHARALLRHNSHTIQSAPPKAWSVWAAGSTGHTSTVSSLERHLHLSSPRTVPGPSSPRQPQIRFLFPQRNLTETRSCNVPPASVFSNPAHTRGDGPSVGLLGSTPASASFSSGNRSGSEQEEVSRSGSEEGGMPFTQTAKRRQAWPT